MTSDDRQHGRKRGHQTGRVGKGGSLLSLGTVMQLLSLELAVLDLSLQRWTQDLQMSSGKPLSRFVKSSSFLSTDTRIHAPIIGIAVVHMLLYIDCHAFGICSVLLLSNCHMLTAIHAERCAAQALQ